MCTNHTKINNKVKILRFSIWVYLIDVILCKLLSCRNTKYYGSNTARLFSRVKKRIVLYFVLCVSRKYTKLKNNKNKKCIDLQCSYVCVPTLCYTHYGHQRDCIVVSIRWLHRRTNSMGKGQRFNRNWYKHL